MKQLIEINNEYNEVKYLNTQEPVKRDINNKSSNNIELTNRDKNNILITNEINEFKEKFEEMNNKKISKIVNYY